jgi:hypothetical protein
MPTANSAPITSNEINVTLQAQGVFQEAVTDLTQIISQVLEANTQLTSTAMVTTAGAKFGTVVSMWAEDAEDMRSALNWMAEQLGTTAQQMQSGNTTNEELAQQAAGLTLPQFGQGGFVSTAGGVPITPGSPAFS